MHCNLGLRSPTYDCAVSLVRMLWGGLCLSKVQAYTIKPPLVSYKLLSSLFIVHFKLITCSRIVSSCRCMWDVRICNAKANHLILLKVNGPKTDTFSSAPTSPKDVNHGFSAIWLAIPIWDRSHFPHTFGSSYDYLLHSQSEDAPS